MLEDRSGLPLEEFARRWLVPEHRATDWRSGDLPNAKELWVIMEWACSVAGGVVVILMDHTQPLALPGNKLKGKSGRKETILIVAKPGWSHAR